MTNRALRAAWRTFSRSFVLLGLPLLAWGVGDLAGFFAEPARAGYAAVALVQATALGWLFYVTPMRPEPERHYELPEWHAHMYEVILIVAAYGDRRSVLTWDDSAWRWAGTFITLLATVVVIWANAEWSNHLRQAGSSALPDPVLLAGGPFRWIRYPGLLSIGLLALGFAILTRSWIGLVLTIPLAAIFVQRIGYTERSHAGRYGREWVLRCRNTWRLVPYVY